MMHTLLINPVSLYLLCESTYSTGPNKWLNVNNRSHCILLWSVPSLLPTICASSAIDLSCPLLFQKHLVFQGSTFSCLDSDSTLLCWMTSCSSSSTTASVLYSPKPFRPLGLEIVLAPAPLLFCINVSNSLPFKGYVDIAMIFTSILLLSN